MADIMMALASSTPSPISKPKLRFSFDSADTGSPRPPKHQKKTQQPDETARNTALNDSGSNVFD